MDKIRPLSENLNKNGFEYRMIHKKGRYYVFEQIVTPSRSYYEAFEARTKPDQTLNGHHYPARHVFPKDEDFGYSAFSVNNTEIALQKIEILERRK